MAARVAQMVRAPDWGSWVRARALTRILKTGVQDSQLAKKWESQCKKGKSHSEKWESHQFMYIPFPIFAGIIACDCGIS